jgi:hypothetical protein
MAAPPRLDPEDEQAVVAYLKQLAEVLRGESHACLVCQAPVEVYREVGPRTLEKNAVVRILCVYAEPCGHRQWQGRKRKPKVRA